MATLHVYLNTVPKGAGGETSFPELKVEVSPQKGSAILWPNVDATGTPEKKVLHEALPVNGNQVKYAMNIWVRGRSQPDQTWIKTTPGVGQYTLPSVSFPEVVEHGGSQTGGWKYAEHKMFMECLKQHRHKPTQHFFEHLYHAPRQTRCCGGLDIVDHVHWLANYHFHLAQKQWNIDKYEDEKQARGPLLCYCMLEYATFEEASAALGAMHGRDMKGSCMKVAWLCKEDGINTSGSKPAPCSEDMPRAE
eukprot:s2051_g3.t3